MTEGQGGRRGDPLNPLNLNPRQASSLRGIREVRLELLAEVELLQLVNALLDALLGLGDDHEEYLRWLACARGDCLEANAQQDFMMALATFNLRSDADCEMEDEDEAGD